MSSVPTGILFANPASQPLSTYGKLQGGCYLCAFTTGTTSPTNVYADGDLTTPLSQPTPGSVNPTGGTVANSAGTLGAIYLDPSTTYRIQLYAASGVLLWTVDPYVVPGVSEAAIGQALYPTTTAETAAGVTPVNFQYPPGCVDRYGTNTTPGATSMTAAFQAAINQARIYGAGYTGQADVTWGATAPYMLDDVLDCTHPIAGSQNGVTFRQTGIPNTNSPGGSGAAGSLYINHNKYAVFDCIGMNAYKFYDVSAYTNTSTYPQTFFLLGRTDQADSNWGYIFNTRISGNFSVAILYNYGNESGQYVGNTWFNYASDTGAGCVVLTAYNYWQGQAAYMSSQFVTIATGSVSCIGHQFIGGQYCCGNASTTSDVFYLEGDVQEYNVSHAWASCANSNGSTNGRSIVYLDCTNQTPSLLTWRSVKTEDNAPLPSYGWCISNTASVQVSNITIEDSYFATNTYALYSPSYTLTVFRLIVSKLTELGDSGITINGTLKYSILDYTGKIVTGTAATNNVLIGNNSNMTLVGPADNVIIDQPTGNIYVSGVVSATGNLQTAANVTAVEVLASGAVAMFGAPAPTQIGGWGSPGGASVQSNFSGSSATLAQTSAAVAKIITDLKSLGLYTS